MGSLGMRTREEISGAAYVSLKIGFLAVWAIDPLD